MDAQDFAVADIDGIARNWLGAFNRALLSGDYRAAAAMFGDDGYWRDLLSFGWRFRTLHGAVEIERGLGAHYAGSGAGPFVMREAPFLGRMGEFGDTIEFFFTFETAVATGRGHVRLIGAPENVTCLTLLTAMVDL